MLIVNKNGLGLSVLKYSDGALDKEKVETVVFTDQELKRMDADASVTVGSTTSATRLMFEGKNGRITYVWVSDSASDIMLKDYLGSDPDMVITSVIAIDDIDVANNVAKASAGLPTHAQVKVNNKFLLYLPVTWDNGTPTYDKLTEGAYVMAGTLTVPASGIINPSSLKASVTINVAAAIEFVSAAEIADINVENGTAEGSVGLPITVDVTMDDESVVACAVTWDSGTPAYDSGTAGTYTFAGTITVPDGYANTAVVAASVDVVVAAAREIIDAVAIADIDVANGTAIGAVSLPTTAYVVLEDYTTAELAVSWDGGTPAYDGDTEGAYVFAGTLTVPDHLANTAVIAASVTVNVAAA